MKEIKAYIRTWKVEEVVPALKEAGFHNVIFSLCEGTGEYATEDDAAPSLRFHITDKEIVKLELVCKSEHVDKAVKIISKHARTNNPGDGIVYISNVEKAIKIKNGEDARDDFYGL